ncbi:hypothetical protein Goklo_027997 [Gossypium klotzschianum]|uniref:Uncharacterized protein n=1 Tax=Gossypium klotzschianum TaxID=34286 RepID=A0A7J8TZZ2_9ROSI|nr:hypothetical protein [Gossypium klotzschianum]
MDEDMISLDPIEFQSEEELYKDRTSKLNGIPIAIGVMGF